MITYAHTDETTRTLMNKFDALLEKKVIKRVLLKPLTGDEITYIMKSKKNKYEITVDTTNNYMGAILYSASGMKDLPDGEATEATADAIISAIEALA